MKKVMAIASILSIIAMFTGCGRQSEAAVNDTASDVTSYSDSIASAQTSSETSTLSIDRSNYDNFRLTMSTDIGISSMVGDYGISRQLTAEVDGQYGKLMYDIDILGKEYEVCSYYDLGEDNAFSTVENGTEICTYVNYGTDEWNKYTVPCEASMLNMASNFNDNVLPNIEGMLPISTEDDGNVLTRVYEIDAGKLSDELNGITLPIEVYFTEDEKFITGFKMDMCDALHDITQRYNEKWGAKQTFAEFDTYVIYAEYSDFGNVSVTIPDEVINNAVEKDDIVDWENYGVNGEDIKEMISQYIDINNIKDMATGAISNIAE